jgi:hypothetical protein
MNMHRRVLWFSCCVLPALGCARPQTTVLAQVTVDTDLRGPTRSGKLDKSTTLHEITVAQIRQCESQLKTTFSEWMKQHQMVTVMQDWRVDGFIWHVQQSPASKQRGFFELAYDVDPPRKYAHLSFLFIEPSGQEHEVVTNEFGDVNDLVAALTDDVAC